MTCEGIQLHYEYGEEPCAAMRKHEQLYSKPFHYATMCLVQQYLKQGTTPSITVQNLRWPFQETQDETVGFE